MNQVAINTILGALAAGAAFYTSHLGNNTMSSTELHDTFTPALNVQKTADDLAKDIAVLQEQVREIHRLHRMDVGHIHQSQDEETK